jgi:uncharacterized membrane protein
MARAVAHDRLAPGVIRGNSGFFRLAVSFMEAFFVLLGLAVIVLAVIGPIGFFLALNARGRLYDVEGRLERAEARLKRIEMTPPPAAQSTPVAAPEPTPQPSALEEVEPAIAARVETPAEETTEMPSLAAPTASPPPLPPRAIAPPPLPPTPPRRGFEELIGTRWTVWVGGLALALGALLLVRYSFEQGYFGPGMRIFMALVLAAALVGAGEWLRHRERHDPTPETVQSAYIPGVLTAAGAIAGFGAIYAAHALYGFIGPASAMILLGLVGIACMVAAALHGPALAGIGLVGSMATPLLVSSDTPSPWPVVLYIAVVALAAYGLARMRRWLWLAVASAVGGGAWALALMQGGDGAFINAAMAQLCIQAALAMFFLSVQPWFGADTEEPDRLATATPAAFGLLGLVVLSDVSSTLTPWLVATSIMAALLVVTGLLSAPATAAVGMAGLFILAMLWLWAPIVVPNDETTIPDAWLVHLGMPDDASAFSTFALIASLAIAALCALALLRDARRTMLNLAILCATATLTPLGALVIAWLRVGRGETTFVFPALAAGLAVAFVFAASLFRARGDNNSLGLGAAASGAFAALALGMVFALSGGTLTIALSLAALGAAFVSVKLDIPALRWCVAALGVAVAGRLAWEPRIVGAALSSTPIFNWLLVGYGVPALAFGYASRMMRRARGEDTPTRIAQALTILLLAFLVMLEIRHWLYNGDIYAARTSFVEQGLLTVSAFGFAAVMTRLERSGRSIILRAASLIFGVIAIATTFIQLGVFVNPFFRSQDVVGGVILNSLLIGYAAPALAGLALAVVAAGHRPGWYVTAVRVATIALVFATLSLETRHLYQGEDIDFFRHTSQAEFYTYSLVWLLFGLALLAWGLWRGSREARLASAVFVTLTVLKVFVLDLEGLEGLWRAVSFIGLGLVLIGIGLVYQKLVFARPAGPPPESPPEAAPVL